MRLTGSNSRQYSPPILLVGVLLVLSTLASTGEAVNKYNGKAAVTTIRAKLKAAGYSRFLKAMNDTAYFPVLETILNNNDVTILAPSDAAFAAVTAPVKAKLKNIVTLRQIVAFHVLAKRSGINFLKNVPVKTQFKTADYDQLVAKLPTKTVQFNSPAAKVGAAIIKPEISINYFYAVHGVSRIMIPAKFYPR